MYGHGTRRTQTQKSVRSYEDATKHLNLPYLSRRDFRTVDGSCCATTRDHTLAGSLWKRWCQVWCTARLRAAAAPRFVPRRSAHTPRPCRAAPWRSGPSLRSPRRSPLRRIRRRSTAHVRAHAGGPRTPSSRPVVAFRLRTAAWNAHTASGLVQRRPAKRPKSRSFEHSSAWFSMAWAASCTSVVKLPPVPSERSSSNAVAR